jgi:amino acid adenylation domain-containing protein
LGASQLLPITQLQRSMLLASMAAPHDGLYLIQDVCELVGSSDVSLLRRAWAAVVARHEALRCAVHIEEGDPAGFNLTEPQAGRWHEMDCSTLPVETIQGRLDEFLFSDRSLGFDFNDGPPLRVTVIRTSADALALVLTVHHALLDGRSLTLVWHDWFACYDLLRDGGSLPPPAPALDRRPVEQAGAAGAAFWRYCYRDISQTTGYIEERIPEICAPEAGPVGRERVVLPDDQTRRLLDVARQHGVTLNTMVQGAWSLLLSRYSGRPSTVFGVTRGGRASTSADACNIGFFINTLPLRVDVDPDVPLGPWLAGIRGRWLAMRQVEHTSSRQIAEWTGLPRGMPLFESLLNYDHEPPESALRKLGGPWAGLRFRRLQRTDTTLTLAAYGNPRLALELIYDAARFSRRTMGAAAAHVRQLLESFAAQPEGRLRDLALLTAEERRLLLAGPEPMALPDLCAHELIEQQAARTPGRVALDDGPRIVCYSELNERANRLALQLKQFSTGPGGIIAVCMEPCPASVIAILAILKAGAAFLPVEPALPQERRAAILADASPTVVLCNAASAASLSGHPCEVIIVDSGDQAAGSDAAGNLPNAASPESLAYVIYTSGSTGQPKAVAMTHRGLVNHTLAAALVFGISAGDRRLQMASIGADVFIAEVFNYLSQGAALVFGWDRSSASVREFLSCLEQRRITVAGMPSAWWHEWMAAAEDSHARPPSCLRAVIIGMERADPAALAKWRRMEGRLPRLFNAYGPTETCPTSTVYEAGTSQWEAVASVPIGKPLPNTSAYVLDRDGCPLPVGVVGELCIGGAGVAQGYWRRPDLTAERFVADPFSTTPGRLYRSGDIVFRLPDCNLAFVGRADRQVKIRGFRVELDEVETVLAGHPHVRQCAVVLAGQKETPRLGAFLALRGNTEPAGIRHYLAERLPGHMIPSVFVTLPALPLTPNGKIDRRALPLHELERTRPEPLHHPADTETERQLAGIWREILGVWPISQDDDFFGLGADSLDATRLVTLVEMEFGVEMPGWALWQFPTLARMAAALERRRPGSLESGHAVVPLQPHGSRIPFFCFPGADDDPATFGQLARHLGRGQPFYVVRDPRPMEERGHYTVQQAASRLVQAIREVLAAGPYILGGHCSGGLLAFEAARLLAASGEAPPLVVMLEVATPGYPRLMKSWKNYLKAFPRFLRGELRVAPAEGFRHLVVLGDLARKRVAYWRRRLLRDSPPPVTPASADRATLESPDYHPNKRAARDYRPAPLACDVVQFIAADEHHATLILDDPRLGWRDFVRGRFTVIATPGPADGIFKAPHVGQLAARLESVLAARACDLQTATPSRED